MSDLGDFVILIGKNGSGKSNILEALELLFADVNLQAEYPKSFLNTTWFEKRTSHPIDFEVTIELTQDDVEKVFSKGMNLPEKPEFDTPKERTLVVRRQLEANNWKNGVTTLGERVTIQNGKVSIWPSKDQSTVLAPDQASTIVTNLNNLLKNAFKLTRSPRESPDRPGPSIRPSILDTESKTNTGNDDQSHHDC